MSPPLCLRVCRDVEQVGGDGDYRIYALGGGQHALQAFREQVDGQLVGEEVIAITRSLTLAEDGKVFSDHALRTFEFLGEV